jgi:hypothetical protein
MTRDEAFDAMHDALVDVVPVLMNCARNHPSPQVRKQIHARIEQIQAALRAAREL